MWPAGHAGNMDIQTQFVVLRPVTHIVEAYTAGHVSAAPGTGS